MDVLAAAAEPCTDRVDARVVGGGVSLSRGVALAELHPLWLRERSIEPGDVDPANLQRLFEPCDVSVDLEVVAVEVAGDRLDVTFSDGHRCVLSVDRLLIDVGALADPEGPPAPAPWRDPSIGVPTIGWDAVESGDADRLIEVLGAYFRCGFFRIRGAPTAPGSLLDIAGRFGRVSATNFGELFDVRSIPEPVDLAYTSVALSAHTDQPYRRPTPGLQFLHSLVNDAPGGDSTVVDGLAAVESLGADDPEAFELLCTTDVEFRYDIGRDVVVGRSPIIELDHRGELRQFRFSPRLDFGPALPPARLDVYYRGRRRLAEHLNRSEHRITFRLAAGDVLVVDNHRVLHGRTSFDPTVGHRHFQGCYIDHDGPDTMWRLARRSRRRRRGTTP